MTSLFVKIIVVSTLLLNTASTLADPINEPFHLGMLLSKALANNPELKAAEYKWRRYENKISQTGVLDDPFLAVVLNNYPVDSWAANESPMSGKVLKLSQNFPFPGKLATKKEQSKQQASWYQGVYEEGKLQLARKVKDAYYSLFFYDRALKISHKNLAILDDIIRLTETNYEIGKGLQQDVLKAQVERSKLIDRTYGYTQKLERAVAELINLTNQQLPPFNDELADIKPVPAELNQTIDEFQQSSEEHRPLFSAYRALIEQNKLQKKLAELEYKPNFKLGASYTFREPTPADDGTDFASIEFGMNIPFFFGKRQAAVSEADNEINMTLQQRDNFRNTVYLNIHDSFLEIKKSGQQVELYRNGLIPQAAQTFEAALSGYQVGKVDFLSLLDSLMTLYNYELEYYRVLVDGQRGLARLVAETGLESL